MCHIGGGSAGLRAEVLAGAAHDKKHCVRNVWAHHIVSGLLSRWLQRACVNTGTFFHCLRGLAYLRRQVTGAPALLQAHWHGLPLR